MVKDGRNKSNKFKLGIFIGLVLLLVSIALAALPSITSISLNATSTNNYSSTNLTLNLEISDSDGDAVKNITTWYVNGTSIFLLNMPFEEINSTNGNNSWDYSGFGNNGSENSAIWNATGGFDGKGAYEFNNSNSGASLPFSPNANDFTVAFYGKYLNYSSGDGHEIFSLGDVSGLGFSLGFSLKGNSFFSTQNISLASWNKYNNTMAPYTNSTSYNGQVPPGLALSGDSDSVTSPHVILDNGIYKMWYSGTAYVGYTTIFYATSPDGLTWTKYNNTYSSPSNTSGTDGRLPLGEAGSGDLNSVSVPSVIKDGGNYKMWYTGIGPLGVTTIFYATSSDGLTWTKYNNNVSPDSDVSTHNGQITRGSSGKGDAGAVSSASVIKDSDTYKMWYTGRDGSSINRVYYATSPDGLNWTKHNNSIPQDSDGISYDGQIPLGTTGKGDDGGVFDPFVLKDGDTYKMWYRGSDGANHKLYYATSPDGLIWKKYNNSIPSASDNISYNGQLPNGTSGKADSLYLYNPTVLKDGNLYKLWYGARNGSIDSITYATLDSGFNGSSQPENTWTQFALTKSGSTATLYVDGQEVASSDFGSISLNGTLHLGDLFNGSIDDLQIYNRSLSATQVLALYNNRTDLIVSAETTDGDVWSACVTPNDGTSDGAQSCSNNLTVLAIQPPSTGYSGITDGGYYNESSLPGTFTLTLTDDGTVNISSLTINVSGTSLTNQSSNVTCTPSGDSTSISCLVNLTGITFTDSPSVLINSSVGNLLGVTNDSISLNFTYDTVVPNITLEYPLNNTWVKTLTPSLNFSYSDASPSASCVVHTGTSNLTVTALNNTQTLAQYTSSYSFYSGYSYDWYVVCTDLSSNLNQSTTWNVSVDNVKPGTALTYNDTTAGTTWVNSVINVTVVTGDRDSGVNYTEWLNASGSWTHTGDSFLVDKNLTNNVIYYRTIDNANNTELKKTKLIYVDLTAPSSPTFKFSATTLAPNASLGVEVTSNDSLSGLSSTATAYLHNGTNDSISSTTLNLVNNKYVGVMTMPELEHAYNFTVTLVDVAGNTLRSNSSLGITVNNSLPTITANVSNGSYVGDNSVVSFTLTGTAVSGSYNYSGGSIPVNVSGLNFNVTITSENFGVNVTANNSQGYYNYTFTYFVDNKGPEATIGGVNDGDMINATHFITANATDVGIGTKNVTWLISKVGSSSIFKNYSDSSYPYSFTFDTMATVDGNYSINLTTTDYLGNTNQSSISVLINNTAISVTSTADDSGEVDLSDTDVGSSVETITGLNSSSNVTLAPLIPATLALKPSSSQLSETIYVMNITADTPGNSRVYFKIPLAVLDNLGISANSTSIRVYADHGEGSLESLGAANYVESVPTADGIDGYARYYFTTTRFSVFFMGEIGSTTTSEEPTTSGGSNGGGGGSAVSAKEGVYTQEVWNYLAAGERVTMIVDNVALGVSQVSFKVNKDIYGGWVKANIRYDFPATVGYFAKGVYKKFEIIEGASLTPEVVEDVKIVFKVSKSWLTEHNNLAPEVMKLYRWTEQWDELPTELLGEEGDYYTYEASSPGFSFFIIGVSEKTSVTEPSVPAEEGSDVTVSEPESKGMSTGMIVGLIIGGLVVLGLIVALVVFFTRRGEEKPKARRR